MKWIGLILLVCCGALAGIAYSGKLRSRIYCIEKLCSLLREMGVLMQYQMSTLWDLMDTLSERTAYREFHFLSAISKAMQQDIPFTQAWKSGIEAEKQLPSETREILLTLGDELGTTDLDGQLSALSQAHIQLQNCYESAKLTYQKKGKLYRSLGLLAGLLLAILFC